MVSPLSDVTGGGVRQGGGGGPCWEVEQRALGARGGAVKREHRWYSVHVRGRVRRQWVRQLRAHRRKGQPVSPLGLGPASSNGGHHELATAAQIPQPSAGYPSITPFGTGNQVDIVTEVHPCFGELVCENSNTKEMIKMLNKQYGREDYVRGTVLQMTSSLLVAGWQV